MNKRLTHLPQLLFLVAMATGCSSISYVEPTSGDLARVRFSTNESNVVVVRAYESSQCDGEHEWMRLRNGVLVNSDPKSLGIPLQNYNKNAFKEFYVPAKSEKVVMVVTTAPAYDKVVSCGVALSLSFLEKGKDYELHYGLTSSADSCAVTVSEIQSAASGQAAKKTLKTYTNSLAGFGEACLQAFKKQRMY